MTIDDEIKTVLKKDEELKIQKKAIETESADNWENLAKRIMSEETAGNSMLDYAIVNFKAQFQKFYPPFKALHERLHGTDKLFLIAKEYKERDVFSELRHDDKMNKQYDLTFILVSTFSFTDETNSPTMGTGIAFKGRTLFWPQIMNKTIEHKTPKEKKTVLSMEHFAFWNEIDKIRGVGSSEHSETYKFLVGKEVDEYIMSFTKTSLRGLRILEDYITLNKTLGREPAIDLKAE